MDGMYNPYIASRIFTLNRDTTSSSSPPSVPTRAQTQTPTHPHGVHAPLSIPCVLCPLLHPPPAPVISPSYPPHRAPPCMHRTPHSACLSPPTPRPSKAHTAKNRLVEPPAATSRVQDRQYSGTTTSADTAGRLRPGDSSTTHHRSALHRWTRQAGYTLNPRGGVFMCLPQFAYLPQCAYLQYRNAVSTVEASIAPQHRSTAAPQHRRRRALTGGCVSAHASAHGGRG